MSNKISYIKTTIILIMLMIFASFFLFGCASLERETNLRLENYSTFITVGRGTGLSGSGAGNFSTDVIVRRNNDVVLENVEITYIFRVHYQQNLKSNSYT